MKVLILFAFLAIVLGKPEDVEKKTIAKSDCPGGWYDVGSKCLFILDAAEPGREWELAAEFCKDMGGEMISWTDESEYFQVKFILAEKCVAENNCENWYWTGARLNEDANVWMWENGDLVPDFSWNPGQPWAAHTYATFHGGDVNTDMFGNDGSKQGYAFICQIVKM